MTFLETFANNPIRIFLGDFLSKLWYSSNFIEIDTWMLVHAISGGLLMWFLYSKWLNNRFCLSRKCKYVLLISALVLFEIVEYFFYTNPTLVSNGIFLPESKLNVLWDLIFAIGGAFIFERKI